MDIVSTLYNIEKAQNVDRLKLIATPILTIPNEVVNVLATFNLQWESIPNTTKHALLWSFGYVQYGHVDMYAKVYGPCAKGANTTMDMIQISDTPFGCEKDAYSFCGFNKYIKKACPGLKSSLAKCAIQFTGSPTIRTCESGVYWGLPANNFDLPPNITILKNSPTINGLPYSIHIQPSSDTCATTDSMAATIPCVEYTSSDGFCSPTPTQKLYTWLQEIVDSRSTTMAPSPAITSVDDQNTISKITTSTIVEIVCGGVVLLAVVAFLLFRRRRRAKKLDVDFPYVSSSNGMSVNEMELSNERLCDSSPALKTFQVDPNISFKRLDYAQLVFVCHLSKSTSDLHDVWRGNFDNEPVAIKQLSVAHRQKKNLVYFASSIQIMATLVHPNITKVLGVGWDLLENMCIVTEYMERGTLRENLDNQLKISSHRCVQSSKDLWNWKDVKLNVATDIAKALVYFHTLETPLTHSALHSSNVLLNNELTAKLSAFAVKPNPHPPLVKDTSRWEWIAPEVLSGQPPTTASDVYAFGVIMAELDTLCYPYATAESQRTTMSSTKSQEQSHEPSQAQIQRMQQVVQERLRPELSSTAPQALKELVELCLDADPSNRPTAMILIYHLRSKIKVNDL